MEKSMNIPQIERTHENYFHRKRLLGGSSSHLGVVTRCLITFQKKENFYSYKNVS